MTKRKKKTEGVSLVQFQEGDVIDISFLSLNEMVEKIGFGDESWIDSDSDLGEFHWKLLVHGGHAVVVGRCGEDDEGITVVDPCAIADADDNQMDIYEDIVREVSLVRRTDRVKFNFQIENGYRLVVDGFTGFAFGLCYSECIDWSDPDDRPDPEDCDYNFKMTREQASELRAQLSLWLDGDASVSPGRRAA